MPSFNIALVRPEIPHNTGAIGRLCLASGACLHLIKPLGFSLEDKHLHRAGLDYWNQVNLKIWENWEQFSQQIPLEKSLFLTTKSEKIYWDCNFTSPCYLIFGSETRGLPEPLLNQYSQRACHIPMETNSTRSLNLNTAVGITLYEAMRQRTKTLNLSFL